MQPEQELRAGTAHMSRSPEHFSRDEFPSKGKIQERENEKTEEEAEVAPITERFLETLYSSPAFWTTLKETWQKVEQFAGREHGFSIWKDTKSDFTWLSKPHGGEDEYEIDTIEERDNMLEELGNRFPEQDFLVFGGLHFHTMLGDDPLIVPSGINGDLGVSADLRSKNEDTGYDIPTMEMIAARNTAGGLKILVYQEPLVYAPAELPHIWQELSESITNSTFSDQEEVLDILRHYRYRAEILRNVKDAFLPDHLRTLTSFSFHPKRQTREPHS
jgi:hypothetical protein